MWKKRLVGLFDTYNGRSKGHPTPYDIPYRKVVEVQGNDDFSILDSVKHIFGEEYIDNLPISRLSQHFDALKRAGEMSTLVPLYRRGDEITRGDDRPTLLTGEAIELLEFQRLAAQAAEDAQLNASFNAAITAAAILVRPYGQPFPVLREERDYLIRKQKEFWFDALTFGDVLALNRWFSGEITALQENKEYQFFWKGRPQVRSNKRKSAEATRREAINREISAILGLRQHYTLWADLFETYEAMFNAPFSEFVFRANLKIAQGS